MDNQNPTPNPAPPIENVPVQPIQQPPPSSTKSFFSTKIILLIMFLLIILGAGGTYLALNAKNKPQSVASTSTPTTAPTPLSTEASAKEDDLTAGWRTYENGAYGYSIKYPPDWSFYEKKSNIVFGPLSTKNHIGETVPEYVSSYITLDIYTSPQNTDLAAFKKISSDLKPVWKDFKIGEINGKEVKHLGCLSGNCREVLFQINELVFNFFEQNNLKELDQILSTFQFTN